VLGFGYARLVGDMDVGQPWWTEARFMAKQRALGYRLYGRIEGPPGWPAVAIGRVDAKDVGGITFTGPSGVPHTYRNFPGIRFKAVTMLPAGSRKGRFVVVLGKPEPAR